MPTPVPLFLARLTKSLAAQAAATQSHSVFMTVLMTALAHFTYVALIVVLIIAGTGVPIPEDVPLIFAGYLCNEEHSPILEIPRMVDQDGDGIKETSVPRRIPNVYVMMLAGMLGVLVGDSMVFTIGRRGIDSQNFIARHLRKVMHSKRREKVERHFAKHGNLTIFVGRFMPGFRSIIFAFAGMSKMSYPRFLMIDGLAAIISVPVFVYLGYHFAADFNWFFAKLEKVKHIVTPVILIIFIGAGVLWYVRRKRAPAAPIEPV